LNHSGTGNQYKVEIMSMNNAVTVATFTSNFDMKFFLFKEMLDEAGIKFMVVNEITSTVDGVFAGSPTNMGIEIRVLEEKLEEATQILDSIK
jgi:hypothetical protein